MLPDFFFSKGPRQPVYYHNIEKEEVADAERAELTDNAKEACQGKQIKTVILETIDKETYNSLANNEITNVTSRVFREITNHDDFENTYVSILHPT